MPLKATLDNLFIQDAETDGGNGAEWRLLFSSISQEPQFLSAWSQDHVFDGQQFSLNNRNFTSPTNGISLEVSGFENDGRHIEIRDLLPSISLDFQPSPGGRLPLGGGGFDYELTVRAGVGNFLRPKIDELRSLLPSEAHDDPFSLQPPNFTGFPYFGVIEPLDPGGLPASFSVNDFGYEVVWRIASSGIDQPVEVTLESLHVLQAGEDGNNGLAEWHPTFAAGTTRSLDTFSTPELLVRDNQTFNISHAFTVDRSGNDVLVLRTGGFESDSGGLIIGRSFLDRIFGGASFPEDDMLPTTDVRIHPVGNGFDIAAAVDGVGAYSLSWHVDALTLIP